MAINLAEARNEPRALQTGGGVVYIGSENGSGGDEVS